MVKIGYGWRRLEELDAFNGILRKLIVEVSAVLQVEGVVQGDVVVSCKASKLANVLQTGERTGTSTSYHNLGFKVSLLKPCDCLAKL